MLQEPQPCRQDTDCPGQHGGSCSLGTCNGKTQQLLEGHILSRLTRDSCYQEIQQAAMK